MNDNRTGTAEKNRSLGERLRCLRQRDGHTQLDVALYLGIDKSTYAHYESGRRTPDAERLRRLAEYYHLVDEILGVGDPFLSRRPIFSDKKSDSENGFPVVRFPVLCPHEKIDMSRVYPIMQPFVIRIFDTVKTDRRVSSIVLFGSSVTQRCHKGSDLDLAVRLRPDSLMTETKNEVSLKLQESTDWNADILWFDRLSPEDRIYPEILKGVQIA